MATKPTAKPTAKPAAKPAAKSSFPTAAQYAAQSAAIVKSAQQGVTQGHQELDAAKTYQAGVFADNATLAGQFKGNVDLKGNITYPDGNGPVIQGVNAPLGVGGGGGQLPTSTDLTNLSATAILANGLNYWGLSDLAGLVQNGLAKGLNSAAIADMIRGTPSYAARFPAIKALSAGGHAISESQYLAKEQSDREMLYQYLGPTAQNYDNPAQLGGLMTNFVSTAELQGRLQAIHDATNASPDTKAWMKSNLGLSDQDVASAWLDPQLTSDTVARRDAASQIGGAGLTSGFGNLTQAQAEQLATQGVSQSQAQNVFGKLGNQSQLESTLPGNESGSLTQQQILDGAFNGGAAGQAFNRLVASRVGQFQEGGGMAADSSGVVGDRSGATL